MTYTKSRPITAVWEVTMGCNMRCGHCGSSCEGSLPGELTTDEALDLCDQVAELGLSNRSATPLFSPACWELGFQAWAQTTSGWAIHAS